MYTGEDKCSYLYWQRYNLRYKYDLLKPGAYMTYMNIYLPIGLMTLFLFDTVWEIRVFSIYQTSE